MTEDSDTQARRHAAERRSQPSEKHCPSCTCGKRAPVQGEYRSSQHGPKAAGTVAWWEHLKAYEGYAARFGSGQSAERLAERAGFSYGELVQFLGHEPTTWVAR